MASSSACAVGSRRWIVSLWASASVRPSATITAPIGTSSRTDAARARRSAACMPCRSLGDGVPLRTGALGGRSHPGKAQMLVRSLGANGVALVEVALENLERDRVLELALDHALERPSPVYRIVALRGQELLGLRRDLEPDVPGRQQIVQVAQLDVHDVHQVLAAERTEDDDLVHPIEELGTEEVPELVPDPLFHPLPRRVVHLRAASTD